LSREKLFNVKNFQTSIISAMVAQENHLQNFLTKKW